MRWYFVVCIATGVLLVLSLLGQILFPAGEDTVDTADLEYHSKVQHHHHGKKRHPQAMAKVESKVSTQNDVLDLHQNAPAEPPNLLDAPVTPNLQPHQLHRNPPAAPPNPLDAPVTPNLQPHQLYPSNPKSNVVTPATPGNPDEPSVIDTGDMHTVQKAVKQGIKVLTYSPRCPPDDAGPWCQTELPILKRVRLLLSNLTIEEKSKFFTFHYMEMQRIHWHRMSWWNEALHGVAREVDVTSFPQTILLASTFNRSLWHSLATVISDEARGRAGDPSTYGYGRKWMFHPRLYLTFWSPDINIFRDPRWGRGQETPGEDPFLTAEYAHHFVRGLQGDDPQWLKTSACCKHFAGYSVEKGRFNFDAVISDQDLADTYFPAFHSCVARSKVSGIMCSYNAINGVPACVNSWLLKDTLRDEWGFDGYTVSDCDGMLYVKQRHKHTKTALETIVQGFNASMDLDCGTIYTSKNVQKAVEEGLLTEAQLDKPLTRTFTTLFRLGYFNKLQDLPEWALYTEKHVNTKANQQLAKDAAMQGIVLLKNEGCLPLSLQKGPPSIAVIGPSTNITRAMQGNYYGGAPFLVSPIQGLAKYTPNVKYAKGCDTVGLQKDDFPNAIEAAATSDYTFVVVGISGTQERENHDRTEIDLPGVQTELIEQVATASRGPVIVVVISGSSIDVSVAKLHPKVKAILWAGYPGQSGGDAIADIIFGSQAPAGRLPITFYYRNFTTSVSMADMNMRPDPTTSYPGRTYRFFTGPVIYPFGHGLSYTTWKCDIKGPNTVPFTSISDDILKSTPHTAAIVASFSVTLTNTGATSSAHVILAYASSPTGTPGNAGNPIKSLVGFERVWVEAGTSTTVTIPVTSHQLAVVDTKGKLVAMAGSWTLMFDDVEHSVDVA